MQFARSILSNASPEREGSRTLSTIINVSDSSSVIRLVFVISCKILRNRLNVFEEYFMQHRDEIPLRSFDRRRELCEDNLKREAFIKEKRIHILRANVC